MRKRRLTRATLTILIVLSGLASCASLKITTWILKQGELVHGQDRKAVLEAEDYRCYSRADDSAWREELKLQRNCCNGRSE